MSRTAGARRATLVAGGAPLDGRGFWIAPTVVADVTDGMTIAGEEVFSHVPKLLDFETEDEVLIRANATSYGLAAGVFTRDLACAHRVVEDAHAVRADLPGGIENGGDRARDGGLDVGIRDHDHGRLAAQLQRDMRQLSGGSRRHLQPRRNRSGDRQFGDARLPGQRRHRLTAGDLDGVVPRADPDAQADRFVPSCAPYSATSVSEIGLQVSAVSSLASGRSRDAGAARPTPPVPAAPTSVPHLT